MHAWPWPGFAQLMLRNAGRSLLATSAAILAARPWRFVPKGSLRRLDASGAGLALLNYILAYMAYVGLQAYEVQ
jgi:hypothetical protein